MAKKYNPKGKPNPHHSRLSEFVSNGKQRGTLQQTAITFDPDVFREIQSRARANGISFASQVRLLVNQALTQS